MIAWEIIFGLKGDISDTCLKGRSMWEGREDIPQPNSDPYVEKSNDHSKPLREGFDSLKGVVKTSIRPCFLSPQWVPRNWEAEIQGREAGIRILAVDAAAEVVVLYEWIVGTNRILRPVACCRNRISKAWVSEEVIIHTRSLLEAC